MNTHLPKISVITPSYNQAIYLEETIRSVIEQNYPNLEYFVIDGNSTDNSVEIIKKYESQITYWVSEPDRGQSDAINKGFAKATGDLIAFLNSDDTYFPDALHAIASAYKSNPNFSAYYGVGEFTNAKGEILNHSIGAPIDKSWIIRNGMIPRITQPAVFFNKKYLNRSFLVRTELRYVLDLDLILYLLNQAPFLFIEKQIATYRLHAVSKTVGENDRMMHEAFKVRIAAANNPLDLKTVKAKYQRFKLFELLPQWFRKWWLSRKKTFSNKGGFLLANDRK